MKSDVLEPVRGKVEPAKPKMQPPPMWVVLLFNDPRTHAHWVADVLAKHFQKSHQQSWEIMMAAHRDGHAAVGFYPKDIAETKVDIIMKQAKRDGFNDFNMSAEPKD